jgi:hypothetical protein
VPLLGRAEKAQLEELILKKLHAYYDANGAGAMLADKLRVIVTPKGPEIDSGEAPDPLASVQVRTLFTALCYLTAGAPSMPRESLDALATEATSSCAAQINKLGGN